MTRAFAIRSRAHVPMCVFTCSFAPANRSYSRQNSAWRGFIKNNNNSIRINLARSSHVVRYPINDDVISFVGVVKTSNKYKEQWKAKGSIEDMRNDLSMHPSDLIADLSKVDQLYKWGIYTRPQIKTLIKDGITLLGDAAHPIVPFLGQGGCMALEDAYIFGCLCHKFQSNFELIQKNYQQTPRPKRILTSNQRMIE